MLFMKKNKKLKHFSIKLNEDLSISLKPNRPQPYKQFISGELILKPPINHEDFRYNLLERVYELSRKDGKNLFFCSFTFKKGTMGFDLCSAVWSIL